MCYYAHHMGVQRQILVRTPLPATGAHLRAPINSVCTNNYMSKHIYLHVNTSLYIIIRKQSKIIKFINKWINVILLLCTTNKPLPIIRPPSFKLKFENNETIKEIDRLVTSQCNYYLSLNNYAKVWNKLFSRNLTYNKENGSGIMELQISQCKFTEINWKLSKITRQLSLKRG